MPNKKSFPRRSSLPLHTARHFARSSQRQSEGHKLENAQETQKVISVGRGDEMPAERTNENDARKSPKLDLSNFEYIAVELVEGGRRSREILASLVRQVQSDQDQASYGFPRNLKFPWL